MKKKKIKKKKGAGYWWFFFFLVDTRLLGIHAFFFNACYTCIYMYMYVYIYTCIYMHIYRYTCIYTTAVHYMYMYTCIYIHVYIYTCIHTSVFSILYNMSSEHLSFACLQSIWVLYNMAPCIYIYTYIYIHVALVVPRAIRAPTKSTAPTPWHLAARSSGSSPPRCFKW